MKIKDIEAAGIPGFFNVDEYGMAVGWVEGVVENRGWRGTKTKKLENEREV